MPQAVYDFELTSTLQYVQSSIDNDVREDEPSASAKKMNRPLLLLS